MKTKPTDHLFRNEFSKAVSILTGRYGAVHLEAIEDAVQDALLKAVQSWSINGIPNNPSGWIIRVAQNKLIDHFRRQQKVTYATKVPDAQQPDLQKSEEFFNDEMIKMMFAVCNPRISSEYQLILTLKILGGLSIREIASAILKKEETVAKSYTRAKKKFKEAQPKLKFPDPSEVADRLNMVVKTIYIVFNEGYKTTEGNELIRLELCEEAMRLCDMLLQKPETTNASTQALMALMLFHYSRFDSRLDSNGIPLSIEDQDRSKWSQRHIELGNRYMISVSDPTNEYFIQAAISGMHCNAKTYDQTDWHSILKLYDQLIRLKPHPLIALNRILPLSKVYGPDHALSALKGLENENINSHYLFHATKAEIFLQKGEIKKAISSVEMANQSAVNNKDKDFFGKKLNQIISSITSVTKKRNLTEKKL